MKPSRHLTLLRALTASFSSAATAKSKRTRKPWKISTPDPPPPPPAVKSQPPKTIRLTDDIRNSASFVGNVKGPVQRVDVPGVGVGASAKVGNSSGKNASFDYEMYEMTKSSSGGIRFDEKETSHVCGCQFLVGDSAGKNGSFEILLKIQDKMVEMCLEHIKQNGFLHVSARVESYTKTDENEKSQTCCEVIVKELNYVSESEHSPIEESVGQLDLGESEYSPIDKSAGQSEASPTAKNAGQSNSGGVPSSEKQRARIRLWQQFFADPSKWYDNRTSKKSPNRPGFKHKDSGECYGLTTMILLGLKSNFSSSTLSLEHKTINLQ